MICGFIALRSIMPCVFPAANQPSAIEDQPMQIAKQLAIFLDNRPGTLARVCDALSAAKINIYAFITTSDTVDHSVIRMVVNDSAKAMNVFEEHGTLVVEDDVLMIEGDNKTGSLASIAHKLAEARINIEYCYCATSPGSKRGLMIMRASNPQKAPEGCLTVEVLGRLSSSRACQFAHHEIYLSHVPKAGKVVIIGSGCAGLTAALYTARANLQPLVLTAFTSAGCLLPSTSIVENFPGFPEGIDGYELMVRMQKQAERFGARVKFATVEGVNLSKQPFVLTVDGEQVQTETVIIASGASHRHLGLDSEAKLEKKGRHLLRHLQTARCPCFAINPSWSSAVGIPPARKPCI